MTGCGPDAPRTPTQPSPKENTLSVQSVSAFIESGDYQVYLVRLRVRETAGSPIAISEVVLQFLGEGLSATRRFPNIPKGNIAAGASVELDDLVVSDELHELDKAKTVVATVTYRIAAGETWAAVGTGTVPDCGRSFLVWGPPSIAVGQTIELSGGLEFVCSPMWYPLSRTSIQWRSLNPAIATVDAAGRVTGVARGNATIQGTYGRVVSSYRFTVGG